jgi:hypothetical protein
MYVSHRKSPRNSLPSRYLESTPLDQIAFVIEITLLPTSQISDLRIGAVY